MAKDFAWTCGNVLIQIKRNSKNRCFYLYLDETEHGPFPTANEAQRAFFEHITKVGPLAGAPVPEIPSAGHDNYAALNVVQSPVSGESPAVPDTVHRVHASKHR